MIKENLNLKKTKKSYPSLNPGDCLIHHSLVVHGSNKNYSNNSYDVFGEDFPITLHEVNWNCSDNMSSEKALDKFVKDLIEVLTKTS